MGCWVRISTADAKDLVLQRRAAGVSVKDAMQAVGRSYETWKDWRKNDPQFKQRADRISESLKAGEKVASEVPDFPEFAEKYLRQPLPLHQLRAWDVLEGRTPRDFWLDAPADPGPESVEAPGADREPDEGSAPVGPGEKVQRYPLMRYQEGSEGTDQVILNFPPNHGKSATWTINWVTWLINRDPSIRIIIVSKTQRLAKQFLLGVKQRLTHPRYEQMHAAFGPEGGWRSEDKADGLAWREDMIYVKGRNPEEKDPTVQALGIGGQIYGTRADLVVLDDCEDLTNYASYEAHANWVAQEVSSRLEPGTDGEHPGRLVVLGTRVGSMDMYRYLRDSAKDLEDEPTYTYFSQPAILENDHSSDWTTWKVLWPERMTPQVIRKKRASFANPRHFQLIYQQNDVPDDATFPSEAVNAAVNKYRFHGPMTPMAPGHRRRGQEGLYVVGSWDPASSAGYNAMSVGGVDRKYGLEARRWVLDVWTKKGVYPAESIQRLKDWTVKYKINEWRIEKNAVQQFITQLPEIRDFLTGKGCRLVEHETRQNKWDPDKGVEATLQPLFLAGVELIDGRMVPRSHEVRIDEPYPDGDGRIDLPSTRQCSHVETLVGQLSTWEPNNKRQVQDMVMSLWFMELGFRAYLRGGMGSQTHFNPGFIPRGAQAKRGVFRYDQ